MSFLYIYDWSYEISQQTQQTIIRIFGLNEKNNTVSLIINDFYPYFYLELPNHTEWTNENIKFLNDALDTKYFKYCCPKLKTLTKKQKLYFAQKNTFNYLKLNFTNTNNFKNFEYRINKQPLHVKGLKSYVTLKTHETRINPILQFTCFRNIPMSGWVEFEGIECKNKETSCDFEYHISCNDIRPSNLKLITPKPLILSFDIEVYSSIKNQFPNASISNDCIFQISMIFWNDFTTNYLLSLGNPLKSIIGEDVNVLTFESECDLLISFINLIKKLNPQIITGWNIYNFDFPYIIDRCEYLLLDKKIHTTGMVNNKYCKENNTKWSSSAYSHQSFKYIEMDGRIIIDLITYTRREYKFPNYKLDTIAHHFLNSTKDPITAKDIFKGYELGMTKTKEGDLKLGEIGKYCVKDSVLVKELFDLFDTWIGLTEMSSVCYVPCSYLYSKGQQIRVFSQVYKYCYDNNIVVENVKYNEDNNDKFKGAFVKQPIPGLYKNVIPFDFKSLYPTIIIAYNIDYSSFVIDDSIPDHLCHIIEWNEDSKNYRFKFLKKPKGVLPSILVKLLNARNETKKQLGQLKVKLKETLSPEETEQIKNKINILDKRQLAFKVSGNSVYGILGTGEKGMLPLISGAMCVTALGRFNIKKATEHLETCYKANVIYNDTDSCYCIFEDIKQELLWDKALKIQDEIVKDEIFPKPMMLEFEKDIYELFLILKKKRYIWKYLNKSGGCDEIGSKGVLLERRDNSKFIKDVYKNVIDHIFQNYTCDNVLNYIIEIFNDCCSSIIPYTDFIITKKVGDIGKKGDEKKEKRGNYKVKPLPDDLNKRLKRLKDLKCTEETFFIKTLPAHVQLAERMRKRGIKIDAGQRLEYVVILKEGTNKLFDKVEDPEYQQQFSHILKIDYLYYIKYLIIQLDEILDLVFKIKDFTKTQHKLRIQKQKYLKELTFYFKPKLLFT